MLHVHFIWVAAKWVAMNERARIERLLWRAGCGPRPGEVDEWTGRGESQLVEWLLSPEGDELDGERPIIDGKPLDPANVGDHDILWWLDRFVRTRQPLAERMAFNWHDHFAVSNHSVGDAHVMLRYAGTLRRHSLGSVRELTLAMTHEPAMWMFLDLSGSHRDDPNENFARELFELFTLGANNGYTEADIREAARALTGFWWSYDERKGGWDPDAHDHGIKTIFGASGPFMPRDVANLAIDNPAHAPMMCAKLWSYLSATDCPTDLLDAMVAEYRGSDTQLVPVLRLALSHEAFFAGDEPDQVKSPLLYLSGLLRGVGRPVDLPDWAWRLSEMGQVPFYPPNVSGWSSGDAWLSTATVRARFQAAERVVRDLDLQTSGEPAAAVEAVRSAIGQPWASETTIDALVSFTSSTTIPRPERLRVIAQCLLAGPDAQVA